MSLSALEGTTGKAAALVVIRYWRLTQGYTIHRAAAYDYTGRQVWDSGKDGCFDGSYGIKRNLEAAGVDHAAAVLVEYWARTKKEFKAPFDRDVVKAAGCW